MTGDNLWRSYQTKLLGGGLLLVALVFVAALLSHFSQTPETKKEIPLAVNIPPVPSEANKTAPVPSAATVTDSEPSPKQTIEITANAPVPPVPPAPQTQQRETKSAPAVQPPVPVQPQSQPMAAAPVPAPAPDNAQVPPPPAPTVLTPLPQEPTAAVKPAEPAPVAQPEQLPATPEESVAPEEPATPVVTEPVVAQHPMHKPAVKAVAKPVSPPAKKAVHTAPVHEPVASGKYTADEKRLLAMPKNSFTLQILGVNDPKKLTKFINQNHLQSKAAVYKTTLQGKPWYVLVYGQFKTRKEAQAAIAALPAEVQNLHPWPKSMGAVQQGIKSR